MRDEIPTRSPMGDQVTYMDFPEYSQRICERDNLDRMSLYRAIQQAINHGNLQRINRSPIFKQKLESVMGCNDPEDDRCITEMFEDRIEKPYDQRYFHRERQGMEDLYERLQEIEGVMGSDEGPDDSVRSLVGSLQGDCHNMKGRLQKQQSILEDNHQQYQPNHPETWTDLSLTPLKFYKSGHADPDKPYPAIVDKQLERHGINRDTPKVFDNGLILPHYLSAENKKLMMAIDKMLNGLEPGPSVAYMERNLKEMMNLLPSEESGISELQRFWNAIVHPSPDSDESDSDEGSDEEDMKALEEQVKVIHLSGKTEPPKPDEDEDAIRTAAPGASESGAPGEEEEEEEERDEEEEDEIESDNDEDEGGQTGGNTGMYYLKGPDNKASFF